MYYDCVIVGAGSTGCVLAARLSEDPGRTVLLLESGPDFRDVESMPPQLTTAAFDPANHPELLWTYRGRGPAGQAEPLAVIRGRVVGGSGAVNGANFVRNVPEDFDGWGSDLWTFPAVLPYFRKLEQDVDFSGPAHGHDGPIPVGRVARGTWSPFQEAFHDGALRVGFDDRPDHNLSEGSGVGPLPLNNITGVRMNSALAYLNPARGRANLTLRPGATVSRLRASGCRITHVEVRTGAATEAIEAGEVFLCAGGIESPHLLMLSGLGPADELRELGIPVVADLPGVGHNLTDHGTVQLQYTPADGVARYSGLAQTVALTCTAPDSPYRSDLRIQPSVGFLAQASTVTGEAPARMTVNCILDRPTTPGRLRLDPSDPAAGPTVEFRYLEDPFDLERMRFAVRTAARIIDEGAGPDLVSGRRVPLDADLSSDSALDDWLLRHYRTAYHTCGTARMGPADDPAAVVDERCRVRGVEGLRVADLSVMPVVGRGSMNPTAVMIGERLADLVST